MITQLVENFVHLERGRDRLDQNRGANRAARNFQFVLCEIKHVVPDSCFGVTLQFREREIRTAAALDQLASVVKEKQTEIEERCRDLFSIDEDVFFVQMPTSRPNEQNRCLLVELVI